MGTEVKFSIQSMSDKNQDLMNVSLTGEKSGQKNKRNKS
jgi:hypothetical protein